MGTGEFNAGGNPAMDYHPIQGEEEYSYSLNATETGISFTPHGHHKSDCIPLYCKPTYNL